MFASGIYTPPAIHLQIAPPIVATTQKIGNTNIIMTNSL